MAGSIASHIARRMGRLRRVRPVDIVYPGGAVSFSFDDFPSSALTAGAAILEKYAARGTYYAALGLAGSDGNVGRIAERGEVHEAFQRGHELACHTYSHLDCSRASGDAILGELRRNADALAELLDGFVAGNFAYPFGRYLHAAKCLIAPRFNSCRGTMSGINYRNTDLADLRGTRVYAPQFSATALRRMIDAARSSDGWLIFYTHDVAESPSRFGCTPRQLEAVVAYAAERTVVRPVCDVLARLRIESQARAADDEQRLGQSEEALADQFAVGE
jgi:peptidoglycan/xylan/chitin deacetylase (PgdA/CDA1 family)